MKVFLDFVGCRLNQSEIEKMGMQFRRAGYQIVGNAAEADLVVVNTCAVTAGACADSRKKIRSAARVSHAQIVATGCYATADPDAIAQLPSVSQVFPNQEKENLVNHLVGSMLINDSTLQPRQPLPGNHKRTRAFIKVQDGCDNLCTFCLTRLARGRCRSISLEDIYHDICSALTGGAKEIVLTGVNLGSWKGEKDAPENLGLLIEKIIRDFRPQRLRLSSLEPWDVNEDILLALTLPGFCPHLHLPLQSGSDEILRKMARKINKSQYQRIVEQIRAVSPQIAITTDIMVGFPGETESLFEESLAFVRKMNFAGGHVFPFSVRPGTPAENLAGRIEPALIKERSRRMREAIFTSAHCYRENFIGKEVEVLWEKALSKNGCWELRGKASNYLPVKSLSTKNLYNQCSRAFLSEIDDAFLKGIILG